MAKKSAQEKLFGAAVLKVSFLLRGGEESIAYKGIYPGVLRDLGLDDAQVDAFIAEHREAVEKAARGGAAVEEDDE
jgi:hypothetical protein